MTADELQRIALRLSNAYWVRHWLHWKRGSSYSPWVMAIQILNADRWFVQVPELVSRYGFEWGEEDRMYFVDRVDEEGEPFRSPP